MLQREIESDDTAARDAKQEGLLDVKELEQGVQILTLRIGFMGKARGTEAAQIVANDLVMLREGRELVIPKAFISYKAVTEDKRVALTCDFIVQSGTIHSGKTSFDVYCVVHDSAPLPFSSYLCIGRCPPSLPL